MKQYLKSALLAVMICFRLAGGPAYADADIDKIPAANNNAGIMPTPVLLIGTYDARGRADICVADRAGIAGGIGRSKVYVYISLADGHQTKRNIDATGAFTINIADDAHIAQAAYCGSAPAVSGGRYVDKFAAVMLTPKKADLVNAPMVYELPVSMECKVVKTKTFGGGSYTMYIAEVLRVWIEESVMNGFGKDPKYPDPRSVRSVIYYPGGGTGSGYYKTGGMIGKPENHYKTKYPLPGLVK